MVQKHRLIGAEVSYYTGKVRAYLRYKGIAFEEVTPTREVYRDVIVPRTGVRFIPVLISEDDVAIQDSTAIIDFLEQRYPDPAIHPGPLQQLVALLFEVYGDEWLVIPAMHYRWNLRENREFVIQEFGRMSAPNAKPHAQIAIGEKLSRPFAGALPSLGVSQATVAAIEASYLAFLQDFNAHLETHQFLLGGRPSIGDFSLFGPLYAHLYRDPASGPIMQEHAPAVASWVERLNQPQPATGDFLTDDQIPQSLTALLRRMFQEQGPVLMSTIQQLEIWAKSTIERSLPRAIGVHDFRMGQIVSQRSVSPFNLWRWQRVYDYYHGLSQPERLRADALLASTGGTALMQTPIRQRVQRINNRLALASS